MNNRELLTLIENLPDNLKKQVEDFVLFLQLKARKKKIPLKEMEGKWEGLIKLKPDFDEPLEDFKEYM